jgi:hypothetical protein
VAVNFGSQTSRRIKPAIFIISLFLLFDDN